MVKIRICPKFVEIIKIPCTEVVNWQFNLFTQRDNFLNITFSFVGSWLRPEKKSLTLHSNILRSFKNYSQKRIFFYMRLKLLHLYYIKMFYACHSFTEISFQFKFYNCVLIFLSKVIEFSKKG